MAALKLFRCNNPDCPRARTPFEAAQGRCPDCNAADGYVVELVPVHYLHRDPQGPIGRPGSKWVVACQPGLKKLVVQATGERQAVSCPACRASAAYAADEAANVQNHKPVIEAKIAAEQGVKGVTQT